MATFGADMQGLHAINWFAINAENSYELQQSW